MRSLLEAEKESQAIIQEAISQKYKTNKLIIYVELVESRMRTLTHRLS